MTRIAQDAPYDAREAGDILRAQPNTLTRWARDGLFPDGVAFQTPGGSWRFCRAGIAAIVSGDLAMKARAK